MARKKVYGKCRLCGKKCKLTFEHIPPHSTLNNHSVKIVSYEKYTDGIKEKFPWEIDKMYGVIQQKGTGGYYLCKDCNSNAGAWYVEHYTKFIACVYEAIKKFDNQEFQALEITVSPIKLLAVFKQIMIMFCDINEDLCKDERLKAFLLNKDSNDFDAKRYKVYAFIFSGEVGRMNPKTVYVRINKPNIVISDIVTYPVGFELYIDKPDDYIPKGMEITIFSEDRYDQDSKLIIGLPKLESNTINPGDYRTRTEIEMDMLLGRNRIQETIVDNIDEYR